MTLPKDFWETLPSKSDEQLYDMLSHREDYQPEALAAAQTELGRRNLPAERAAQIEAGVQSRMAEDDAKAKEPLSWPIRILVFLFCAGLSGAILAVYYDSKGYKRKSRECLITLVAAVAAHILVVALVLLRR